MFNLILCLSLLVGFVVFSLVVTAGILWLGEYLAPRSTRGLTPKSQPSKPITTLISSHSLRLDGLTPVLATTLRYGCLIPPMDWVTAQSFSSYQTLAMATKWYSLKPSEQMTQTDMLLAT